MIDEETEEGHTPPSLPPRGGSAVPGESSPSASPVGLLIGDAMRLLYDPLHCGERTARSCNGGRLDTVLNLVGIGGWLGRGRGLLVRARRLLDATVGLEGRGVWTMHVRRRYEERVGRSYMSPLYR